jgi:hypothetical protein
MNSVTTLMTSHNTEGLGNSEKSGIPTAVDNPPFPVIVPVAATPNIANSTVLVFVAWNTKTAHLTVGGAEFTRVQVRCP